MTTISVSAPLTTASVEGLLQTLLERFETLRMDQPKAMRVPMQAEIRSLDFWRSIVAECLATFFLIFIICGAAIPWAGHTPPPFAIALAAGFAIASLTLCFSHVSGAHFNPVVTLALLVTRKVSPIKAFLYITAQGGGAIAGAALLYGVSASGHQGTLGATVISAGLSEWQALGIELCLSFILTLVYLTTMDDHRRTLPASIGPGPLTYGLAYAACSSMALPCTGASFNPMRSLGPAFVMNRWDAHWVFWLGPIVGGCLSAVLYEFIFNPYRNAQRRKGSIDGDSSSIHSDEDNYDDIKSTVHNFQSARSQHYDQYRPAITPGGPSNPVSPNGIPGNNWRNRMERAESVYGGTKSLYCKSPGVTRASLNRSQSVYAKPPGATLPVNTYASRPALQAAQSTYLARNVDLIRTESIYASRPTTTPVNRSESLYGQTKSQPPIQQQQQQQQQHRQNVHVSEMNSSTRDPRSPREPIYGTGGTTSLDYGNQRGKAVESYAMEPVYGTRRDVDPPSRSESLYGRKVSVYRQEATYGMASSVTHQTQETETSNGSSAVAISPSDTSKDSAYGSVHGTSMQSQNDWTNNGHDANNSQGQGHVPGSYQTGSNPTYNPSAGPSAIPVAHNHHQSHMAAGQGPMSSSSSSSTGQGSSSSYHAQNAHIYAQKFRSDLVSPKGHHSPSYTPGTYHSPVQY